MTPLTPYLLRAYHEWILDNNCTPYLVVDTYQDDVQVPTAFIQPDGQITLNISPQATGNLALGDNAIEFNARFSGQVHHIYVPCTAVLAIFAKETGQGTAFAVTPVAHDEEEEQAQVEAVEQPESEAPPAPAVVVENDAPEGKEKSEEKSEDKPEKKRGSHLRVVK